MLQCIGTRRFRIRKASSPTGSLCCCCALLDVRFSSFLCRNACRAMAATSRLDWRRMPSGWKDDPSLTFQSWIVLACTRISSEPGCFFCTNAMTAWQWIPPSREFPKKCCRFPRLEKLGLLAEPAFPQGWFAVFLAAYDSTLLESISRQEHTASAVRPLPFPLPNWCISRLEFGVREGRKRRARDEDEQLSCRDLGRRPPGARNGQCQGHGRGKGCRRGVVRQAGKSPPYSPRSAEPRQSVLQECGATSPPGPPSLSTQTCTTLTGITSQHRLRRCEITLKQ
jgi:hypothetical protein